MTSPETLELEAVDAALAGRPVAPEHAELAELALLLRDERPEPSAAWAAALDRRVAAGFPAPARPRRVWLRKAAPALAIAAVLLPVVAGVALIDGPGVDEGGGSSGSQGGLSESAGDDAAVAPAQPRVGGDPESDGRANREQQRSASLTLAVPRREVDRAASRAGQVAAQLGGFVASSTLSSRDGGSVALRVPSDRLDEAVERLSRLGRVRELTRQSVDITSSVVSARERLSDARAERKALLAQLAAADTVNETESIRERLDVVSREIAAARRRLSRVNNQADFADVFVTLTPRADDDGAGAWTPRDAFRDALRVLEVVAGVTMIAAAVLLPLALVWLLAWLARRGLTRRRRERALEGA